MTSPLRLLTILLATALIAAGPGTPASAAAKKEFNIAWTIYV
jgi:hypothetical protein